jgi:hypothetical protein
MKKSKILIVVKTYPEISSKYTETVCTAGISADTKKLMRLYPIRFRYLEGSQQFKKYQWIRANIRKTSADPRPESYNIDPGSIELRDVIPAGKTWEKRYSWLINENTVFSSVESLRAAQKNSGRSLGIIQPKEVKRVTIQMRGDEEINETAIKKDSVIRQLDMFEKKKDLYILPIKIMIEFECQGSKCTGHKMSILYWELGQLYRKVIKGPEWQSKIEAKIMEEIFGKNRDTYIILGNMVSHPQTFCVLGFFWPLKNPYRQMRLFS